MCTHGQKEGGEPGVPALWQGTAGLPAPQPTRQLPDPSACNPTPHPPKRGQAPDLPLHHQVGNDVQLNSSEQRQAAIKWAGGPSTRRRGEPPCGHRTTGGGRSQDRQCSGHRVLQIIAMCRSTATAAAPTATSTIPRDARTTRPGLRRCGRASCGHRTTARCATTSTSTCGHRTTGDGNPAVGVEDDKLRAIVIRMAPAFAPTAPRHKGRNARKGFAPRKWTRANHFAIIAEGVWHVAGVASDDVNHGIAAHAAILQPATHHGMRRV